VLEQLAALVKLSRIDVAARDLDAELERAPVRLEELRGDVKRLEDLLDAERQQVEEARALFLAQEEEIKEQTQSLARSKVKSAKARNMREVEAVERELEVIRRTLKDREGERDRLREAIEQRGSILEQREKELGEMLELVKAEESKTTERIEKLRQKRVEVLAGRDEVVALLPRNLVKRYDTIRSRRAGLGVVELKDQSCSGCHMVLPPQQANAVQRSETLEQCPRCQRILYWSAAIEKPE
jgi:predicted  nucleic acid-binding Zn-ribbon protein